MPTRAKKSQSSPTREALNECTSGVIDTHSIISDTNAEDCSCVCKKHEDSEEWELENEELLHVEINGIFQVGKERNAITRITLLKLSPKYARILLNFSNISLH